MREGVLGFLTASHCTPQQWGYDGSAVQQNDAGGVIGVELADPSHWTGTVNGFNCPAGRLCRESDAAFFSLTADASPGVNRPIAWPNALFTTTFEGYGYVRSQGSPAPAPSAISRAWARSRPTSGRSPPRNERGEHLELTMAIILPGARSRPPHRGVLPR